jgi:peptidoglycan/LPS O-acetylase OafA/YrhL
MLPGLLGRADLEGNVRIPTKWGPGRTLADEFSTRANSIGFLRLVLATSVLVAHAAPLGYGGSNYGHSWTRNQVELGGFGVYGFFVLSGFLITASGMRFSMARYGWHRFLRIFPGFWACLAVTAFVIAPLVALYERDTLAGFWNHPTGPFDYVVDNVFTGMQQYSISGLLATTPYGELTGGPSAFDGSLWSLIYELGCYVMVAMLAWTGVLRGAPRLVLILTGALYALLVADFVRQLPATNTGTYPRGLIGPLPLIGPIDVSTLHLLFMLFLAGACLHLYRHRVPMHPAIAAGAGVAFLGSALLGGFLVIGLPAYVYLLVWTACKLPRMFQGVGRGRDYSYGIYIYAFPVQQVIALLGGAKWGPLVYIALSLAGTLVLAIPSWHLVEKPAMKAKDWTPRKLRRHAAPDTVSPDGTTAARPGPQPAPAHDPAPQPAPDDAPDMPPPDPVAPRDQQPVPTTPTASEHARS